MNPGSVVPWECFISMQEGTSDASPAVSLPRDLLYHFAHLGSLAGGVGEIWNGDN